MPELRWILIGFAIVLLAGIYLWGRRGSADTVKREPTLEPRTEPPAFLAEPIDSGPTRFDITGDGQDSWPAAEEQAPATSAPIAANTGSYARTITRQAETPPVQQRTGAHDTWRGRVEPTFFDASHTAELPVEPQPTHVSEAEASAPTLSSGDTPAPKRIERRKILALRLAASPHKLDGARLLEALEGESLQHGKYDVFHRLHTDGTSIFSIASMVEPGTFDLEKMRGTQYTGVTLFAQLPGPVPGMHALNELVACARRLQQTLGGTLQDDRGVPLTVHRIERLRQEVREFERPAGQHGGPRGVPTRRS
jgi:cell division protein ZipA